MNRADVVRAMNTSCECQCGLFGCASNPRRGNRAGVTVHGTPDGYTRGCGCDDCVAAATRKRARRAALATRETRATATRHGQEWTGPELEIVVRPDLSAREAAQMLGRTYGAVIHARHECRINPRYNSLLGAGT